MYCDQSIIFWRCIYGSKVRRTFLAPRSATWMEPKRKKSAAEKRRDRGPNSPWSQFGSKKSARTDRWYKTNYSPLPATIHQFIEAHNIPHDDLLALLTEHYVDDVPSPSHEASLDTTKQVHTSTKCVVADGPGRSSSSSDQPMESAREELVGAALPALPTAVASPLPTDLPTETVFLPDPVLPPSFDFGVNPRIPKSRRVASSSPHQVITHHVASGSHPNASPPPQPPLPPDGFDPPNEPQLLSGPDEILTTPLEKTRGRAPQIPPQPGKQPAKRLASHRDPYNPIRRESVSCREEREESILAGYPVPPQFTVFGAPLGGTARTSRHSAPEPCPRLSPCLEDHDQLPSHRSVWDNPALPPTVVDDRPPGGAYSIQPNDLFTVGPGLFDDAMVNIALRRKGSYYKLPDGPGYAWATGISPGSVGRRVKAKFAEDGNCRKPFMTALEEAISFTSKRSLPVPVAISDSDLSASVISKVFSSGSLFKIAIGSPTSRSLRSWHSTNLYCAHSIAVRGLLSNKPDHGPDGIYSFSDNHSDKIHSYCDYTLSGTGRAWTVIIEIAIVDTKYKTVSRVQRCSQVEDTSVVAVWLHGLHHSEFTEERIWPRWCPECEIPSVCMPRGPSCPVQTLAKAARKKMSHLSKALTTLLRHRATIVGLAIRPDGFCQVSEVLRSQDIRNFGATIEDVVHMVRDSNKQRLELRTENAQLLVRAAQGHSMPEVQDDLLLRRLSVDDSDLPVICVHGTFNKHL